ncbi:MAG: hypothetical protein R3C05_14945 [Pirellulaceae bacterium]
MMNPAIAAKTWSDYRLATRDSEQDDQNVSPVEEIAFLKATIAKDPHHHDAMEHLLLKCELIESQNDAPLIEKMHTAMSKNESLWNAERLLRSAPLKAIAYYRFAREIESKNPEEPSPLAEKLIQQVSTIADRDPEIQMLLGKRFFMKGQIDEGFRCWQVAFNHDPVIQRSLVKQLRFLFPAAMLVEKLQPETPGMWQLYYGYAEINNTDSSQWLARLLIDRLTLEIDEIDSLVTRAGTYIHLHTLHRRLDERDLALDYIRKAVRIRPDYYSYQYVLATELVHHQNFREAIDVLRWCQVRRPEDANVSRLLKSCTKQSIANMDATSSLR